jgi:hypothetical protein
VRLREEETAVEDRQRARDDDMASAHVATVSANDTRFALLHVEDTRALEDVVAIACASGRRYLRGWNCAWLSSRSAPATGNGRSISSTCSRQPEPLFDFDLPLELVDVVAGFGIDVVGVATEIAVEAEFLDKPADAFERRLLRGA